MLLEVLLGSVISSRSLTFCLKKSRVGILKEMKLIDTPKPKIVELSYDRETGCCGI
jgi:hypothetical protein